MQADVESPARAGKPRGRGPFARFMARRAARRPVVPVVRLQGVIGQVPLRGSGLTLQAIEPALERAFAFKHAPAVALLVNSPGGSPVQSSLIAGRIRQLSREKDKPVVAFIEDVAASGGYWLAISADEVFADASSIVGSIGVVSAGFGFTEAIARLGIERRVHASGESKAMLDPFRPEREGDLAILKEIQDDIFASFKAMVRQRRGERIEAALKESGGSVEDLFDGRVWSGQRAMGLGLIDGLGEARGVMQQRYGEKVRLRVVNARREWPFRRPRIEGEVAAALGMIEERALWARYGL